MIEFVGLVPLFRRITLRIAMETMRFEPSPNRFIIGKLYIAFMVSSIVVMHDILTDSKSHQKFTASGFGRFSDSQAMKA